jgi:acetylornithine/succinyldiaminopimelate/putrescine aminotransferase
LPDRDYPVLRAIVQTTASVVQQLGGPAHVDQAAGVWASAWQELSDGFEFISDVATLGLWAVVQLDLPASQVAAAIEIEGLRLLTSGETTLLACLPINVTAAQVAEMLGTLRAALESMERQTIES